MQHHLPRLDINNGLPLVDDAQAEVAELGHDGLDEDAELGVGARGRGEGGRARAVDAAGAADLEDGEGRPAVVGAEGGGGSEEGGGGGCHCGVLCSV